MEIFPSFDYARAAHTVNILHRTMGESKAVTFWSNDVHLQVDVTIDHGEDDAESCPTVIFRKEKREHMLGEGVVANIHLEEGQAISFVIREDLPNHITPVIKTETLDQQQHDTQSFWLNWISKSKYKGRWREVVDRSLLVLKLLTFEPTGAIIAAPTFSIPEAIGGVRNWDYRYSWIRDSSFTIYILLRVGFTEEADAYMSFITDRLRKSRSTEGALPIMSTIHGGTDIPEIELRYVFRRPFVVSKTHVT